MEGKKWTDLRVLDKEYPYETRRKDVDNLSE
jgi:hypothetical protein